MTETTVPVIADWMQSSTLQRVRNGRGLEASCHAGATRHEAVQPQLRVFLRGPSKAQCPFTPVTLLQSNHVDGHNGTRRTLFPRGRFTNAAVSTPRTRLTRTRPWHLVWRTHGYLDELLARRRLLAVSLCESPLLVRHCPKRERPDQQREGQARCADANHTQPDDADGVAERSLHLTSQWLGATIGAEHGSWAQLSSGPGPTHVEKSRSTHRSFT